MYQRAEAACVSALAVVIAVIALAGCGGSDKKATSTGSATPPAPAQMQEFASCMRKQGLNQSGKKQSQAQSADKMQKAFQACNKYIPKGSAGAPPAAGTK